MDKTIFIYFSYSGDNDKLAELIKRDLKCDILKLETENEYTSSSLKILFQGGKESMTGKLPILKPYNFDAVNYDFIILGSPVWAWTFAPAIRSFLNENLLENKKIILTCSHQGSPGKTIEKFTDNLTNNQIIFSKEIKGPIKDDDRIKQIIEDIKLNIKHH